MITSQEQKIEFYKTKLESTLKYCGILTTSFLTFGIMSFAYLAYLVDKPINSILPAISLLITIGIILLGTLVFATKSYIVILKKLEELYFDEY